MRAKDSRRRLVFGDDGDIEGVDVAFGGERDIEETPPESFSKSLVLILRVNHKNIHPHHEGTDDLEFRRIAFTGTRLCKDHLVRVLKGEPVEDNKVIVVAIDAVHDAVLGGEVVGYERKERRDRT